MGCLKLTYYQNIELQKSGLKKCLTSVKSEKSACRGYIYGFNGKEKDGEIQGEGNSYDYGFRIYNPRLGRFLSLDPLFKGYPFYSPYQFAGNKPIQALDLDGLEEIDYRVIAIDENGNAIVEVEVTKNTTSRSNKGVLLVHNLRSGEAPTTRTESNLLNQVLGIDPSEPNAFNPNIKGGVGTNFTPSDGYSEYYLLFDQSDIAATGVKLLIETNEGNYTQQEGNTELFSKNFILSIPPDPAPESSSPSINLTPPGVVGFSADAFTNTITSEVNKQVANTRQGDDQITQISISYPKIPKYQSDLNKITKDIAVKYPNAEIILNPIEVSNTGNISINIDVTGSPVQNLKP